MMKTMMEMIMLMMVNKMMLLIIVSPVNFENGVIYVGIGPSKKIK